VVVVVVRGGQGRSCARSQASSGSRLEADDEGIGRCTIAQGL
jgi:hypothetical protein